ncbi:MAG TPA: hypothetical protein PKH07_17540 [bacterium]|nr:hypothetical protein [bacterium]
MRHSCREKEREHLVPDRIRVGRDAPTPVPGAFFTSLRAASRRNTGIRADDPLPWDRRASARQSGERTRAKWTLGVPRRASRRRLG